MKLGDSGLQVEYLTLALGRAGYSTGGIKRMFDQNVHDALVAFQNSVGIAADGVAGEVAYEYLLPYLRGYSQRATLPKHWLSDTIPLPKQYAGQIPCLRTICPLPRWLCRSALM